MRNSEPQENGALRHPDPQQPGPATEGGEPDDTDRGPTGPVRSTAPGETYTACLSDLPGPPPGATGLQRQNAEDTAWGISRFGYGLADSWGDDLDHFCVYTVGLTQFDHPELVTVDVLQLTASLVLSRLADQVVRSGTRLRAGELYHVNGLDIVRARVRLVELTHEDAQRLIPGFPERSFNGRQPRALQVLAFAA
ncbi:DUF4262 domain-containing protein [Pedococcus sp. 5OH_020]|uniref:DUF4262 domain-containing protein n=1 Tax=Pedococcus sp. 5OH_020 TaxID=2989814 RepID=UPI0022E9B984|nr:DUF4262 domain-containing protein [Pedococcus sp. 5OH_020]